MSTASGRILLYTCMPYRNRSGIDGLVTIENVVEEIVGEIEDEHDQSDAPHVDVEPDGSVVADARLELSSLELLYKINLDRDEREELDTVGGLVITAAGYVPVRGEVIKIGRAHV